MKHTAIKSALIWTSSTILTVSLYFVMLFLTIVLFPFDKKRKIVHAQCFWWSDVVLALNPYWNLTVTGLENIDKNKTYVVVANHESLADIAVIYQTRMQFKWVAKESLFKIPFLGWSLSLAKHIKLARGKFSSIKTVYQEAAKWLREGVSVLFFPEGTRSDSGDIKDFQNGAFKLAIKEKVLVLPIRLEGTGKTIPKGSWIFDTKVSCRLKVLPAIDASKFNSAEYAVLRNIVRSQLMNA